MQNAKNAIFQVLVCIGGLYRFPGERRWRIYSKYTLEWSPYPPEAAFLQEKISQWLNHQERGGILHHKGLSCDSRLLIHCSYIKIDVGDNIPESIYLEMQNATLFCIFMYICYIVCCRALQRVKQAVYSLHIYSWTCSNSTRTPSYQRGKNANMIFTIPCIGMDL